MSSPITFSGFNQIDFNMILNAVMAQERAPLTRLQDQKKTLDTHDAAFATLTSRITTLQAAAEALHSDEALTAMSARSSDAGVGVSAGSGAAAGRYDVVVTQLAAPQVTTSTAAAGRDAIVATQGTLTLTAQGGAPVTVTVAGPTTLTDLAAAINGTAGSPAMASVVRTAPGEFRLVLTGAEAGTANAFTVQSTLDGGTGITFDGVRTAQDARFTVNGLSATSSTNVVADVVPGATLTLTHADPARTVTVGVTCDVDGLKERTRKFVNAYNDLVAFASDQAAAAKSGRASISRDPVLQALRTALRSALLDTYGSGDVNHMAHVGMLFETGGKLSLDEKAFTAAASRGLRELTSLFTGSGGGDGLFGRVATVAKGYSQGDGAVSGARARISDQVQALNRRLDALEAQLATRRDALQRQYTAADLAMTRLKAQSASLQGIGQQYRAF